MKFYNKQHAWGLSIDKRANSINASGISIREDIRQFLLKRAPIFSALALYPLKSCQDYYGKVLKNAKPGRTEPSKSRGLLKEIKQEFIIEVKGFTRILINSNISFHCSQNC